MDKNTLYFCSDLVRVYAPTGETVGNLELIGSKECTIAVPQPLEPGTLLRMSCLACPSGNRRCTECRFEGRVRFVDDGMNGPSVRVGFEGRTWSPQEWRPRHLSDIPAEPGEPD